MKSCKRGVMGILIIKLGFEESKRFQVRKLVDHMGLLGLLLTSGCRLGLIISQICVRIIKKLVTVGMEIHASLCMIEGITNLGGRRRKNGRKQRKQGREIWPWEWMKRRDGCVGIDDDDELPFACFICREHFVDPVMTKCKHYFCEHCALKHHAKNKKCFICNEPTYLQCGS